MSINLNTEEGVSLPALGHSGRDKMHNAVENMNKIDGNKTTVKEIAYKKMMMTPINNILDLKPPIGMDINPQT